MPSALGLSNGETRDDGAGGTSYRSLLVFVTLAVLGIVVTLVNLKQPFVRNDLVYARAAEHVIKSGYDPRPVVADSKLSYDKPIGFAWLGAPLVATFGTHTGLRVLSLFGTLFFLWAARGFIEALDPFRQSDREHAAALLLVGLNPIVAYQFWSAYPDSLFAGLVLVAWTLTIRLVDEPERAYLRRAALLGLVCMIGLMMKNYALVLLGSVPLYVLLHLRQLWGRPSRPWRMLAGLVAALLTAAAFAALGRKGLNPLVRLAGEGGGSELYGQGRLKINVVGTLLQIAVFGLVNLHVALVFVLRRENVNRRVLAVLSALVMPYVLGLMDFPATYYNMRYFLPLLPFVAVLAVEGWRKARPALRPVAAGVYAIVALAAIAVFNLTPVYEIAAPWIPSLVFTRGYLGLGFLDNLRMPEHRARAEELARVNAQVEPNGVLYMVNCLYYGDAMDGAYEEAGLIRPDIQTRYVLAEGFQPSEKRFYVWLFWADARVLAAFEEVTELGPGLYRVTRG